MLSGSPSAFSVLLQLQITLSSVNLCILLRLIVFVLYGMRLSFNYLIYFMLPGCTCTLRKMNFRAFRPAKVISFHIFTTGVS